MLIGPIDLDAILNNLAARFWVHHFEYRAGEFYVETQQEMSDVRVTFYPATVAGEGVITICAGA